MTIYSGQIIVNTCKYTRRIRMKKTNKNISRTITIRLTQDQLDFVQTLPNTSETLRNYIDKLMLENPKWRDKNGN